MQRSLQLCNIRLPEWNFSAIHDDTEKMGRIVDPALRLLL